MIIKFLHLENGIEIVSDKITTLEINNKSLFTSICESVISDKGEESAVPYKLYEDGKESKLLFNVLASLPTVPINNKKLLEKAYKDFSNNLELDTEAFNEINIIANNLIKRIKEFSLKQYCTYDFEEEWDIKAFLKICKYQVNIDECESLLEKLQEYIKFLADVNFNDVLVFINLKIFLNENELNDLFETLIFYDIKTLLLENVVDSSSYNNEIKYRCDLDLCEFIYR